MAYLGAIRGLEEVKSVFDLRRKGLLIRPNGENSGVVAPSQTSKNDWGALSPLIDLWELPEKRQIRGVSGSSAGAITAFMLALGMTTDKMLAAAEKNEKMWVGDDKVVVSEYERFFGDPDDKFRVLVTKGQDTLLEYTRDSFKKEFLALKKIGQVAMALSNPSAAAMGWAGVSSIHAMVNHFGWLQGETLIKRVLFSKDDRRDSEQRRDDFLYNLTMNGGLFSGFEVRSFFEELIKRELLWSRLPTVKPYTDRNPGTITFKEFYDMTGVDLVIVGVNLTSRQPLPFSYAETPDFPVTEAVAISMNVPILFKPIYIDFDLMKSQGKEEAMKQRQRYQGFFVDGGLLNNLTRNVFDNICDLETTYNGQLASRPIACLVKNSDINLSVLSFMLEEMPVPKEEKMSLDKAFGIDDALWAYHTQFSNLYAGIMDRTSFQLYDSVDYFMNIKLPVFLEEDEASFAGIEVKEGEIKRLETTDFSTPLVNRKRNELKAAKIKEQIINKCRIYINERITA